MSNWRRNWIADKCQLAMRLSRGEAGGGYAEAAILACAALSALAAELWPGKGIDRFRFIEMLVKLGPEASTCSTISVPLLVQHLTSTRNITDAEKLRRAFAIPQISRVLTGSDVDQHEEKILAVCPTIKLKVLRQHSYASILYSEIRSSYAHQYQPGVQADSFPMTMRAGQKVSYINRLSDDLQTHRLLHFHIDWLLALPVGLAGIADDLSSEMPHPCPIIWWSEGA